MRNAYHIHTEYSLKESAVDIGELCQEAKKQGFGGISISDTDSLAGVAEFLKTAARHGLKAVPGAELTVAGQGKVILMAKDAVGFSGLCRAVRQAPLRMEQLADLFGEGSRTHGHVIATSGGMDGVLASVAGQAGREGREGRIKERLSELAGLEKEMEEASRREKELQDKVQSLLSGIRGLEGRTGKNFSRKEAAVLSAPEGPERDALASRLEAEKKDCEEAEKELKRHKQRLRAAKKKLAALAQARAGLQEKLRERKELEGELAGLAASQDADGTAQRTAEAALQLDRIFGGEFYIELFFHGDEAEFPILSALARAADATGIRTVFGNDVHTVNARDEDVARWRLASALKDGGTAGLPPNPHEYCLKTEKGLAGMMEGIIPDGMAGQSVHNLCHLFDGCSMEIPLYGEPPPHFPAGMPPATPDNEGELRVFLGACPQAAKAGVQVRLGARAAIRHAGRVLSGGGQGGRYGEAAARIASAVPKGCASLAGEAPALREAFQGAEELDVIDAALLSDGLLAGLRADGDAYLLSAGGDAGDCAPVLDGPDGRFLPFGAGEAGIFSLRTLHMPSAGSVPAAVDAAALIYGSCGVRVRLDAIGEEPAVMREVFKKGNTAAIPYFSGTRAREALRTAAPGSVRELEKVLEGIRQDGGGPAPAAPDEDALHARQAYACGWLMFHYPKEYLTAALNTAQDGEAATLIAECRRKGIPVYGPDINKSAAGFSIHGNGILAGLGTIRMVRGNAPAIIGNRDGRYRGFGDFAVRSGADLETTCALIKAGAFDCFCANRAGLLLVAGRVEKHASRLRLLAQRIKEKEGKLAAPFSSLQARKQMERSLEDDRKEYAFLSEAVLSVPLPGGAGSALDNIRMEKETLPAPISEHPLDRYGGLLDGTDDIAGLNDEGRVRIAGLVSSLVFSTSKSGRELAYFSLEDRTGSVKVACFHKQLARYRDVLKDGNVLDVYGECVHPWRDRDQVEVHAYAISIPEPTAKQAFAVVPSLAHWEEDLLPKLSPYLAGQGSRVVVYGCREGRALPTGLYIEEGCTPEGVRMAYARTHIRIRG